MSVDVLATLELTVMLLGQRKHAFLVDHVILFLDTVHKRQVE